MPDFKKLADDIILTLKQENINAYIWCEATTGSVYVRFEDQRMCSIRLGDHNGRSQYKYKFNVRSDIKRPRKEKDGEIWRFYYSVNDIPKLIADIKDRRARVDKWEVNPKYRYGTPAHLRNNQTNTYATA